MNTSKYKNKYRIETTRLKCWNYGANGYYFVTICVKNHECVLGCIENGKMVLSEIGRITHQCWQEIPAHFPFTRIDAFIVMPNHIHGIIVIDKPFAVETQNLASLQYGVESPKTLFGPQSKNLASIVRGYKTGVKKWTTINNFSFQWQSRFHERIIRNEPELNKIRKYIINNPLNWKTDENYKA
ncbi:MAG: hypothetical protein E3K37_04220 [Candidatus Kuenenia sp.]|nr:hypothetical protein [Candidatus Kuenenia hertensis]